MTKKNLWTRVVPACVLGTILLFEVIGLIFLVNYDYQKVSKRDPKSYVQIGELYENATNMQKLYKVLCALDNNANYETVCQNATISKNSDALRELPYYKRRGQNIQVRFGGLNWQVCYLFAINDPTTNTQIPVLTLLLADCEVLTVWQNWVNYDYATDNYPATMYGTSYVRAVTLNNGGAYTTGVETLATAVPDAANPFAIFTMDDVSGSVTDALIKPRQVPWQQTQSAVTQGGSNYIYMNEAFGTPSDVGETTNAFLYDHNELYSCWQDDYLWLPSYTEFNFWHLDQNQIKSNENYWLRSVPWNDGWGALYYSPKGDLGLEMVTHHGYAVAPALHLNLSAPTLRASSTPKK